MSVASSPPKISVVIPTWNRAAFIERTINSALTQTLAPIEILVCDDGSSDRTCEIVCSIASNDARVKWLPGNHSGRPAVPRNRGIAEAKGDWIAFLDSDDVWLRDKLRRQYASLSSQNQISLASCSNAYRYVNDQEFGTLVLPTELVDRKLSFSDLIHTNYVITSSVLIHSSILKKAHGFPEEAEFKAIEDYPLWMKVATLTNFTFISTPLLRYTDLPYQSIRQENRSEFLDLLKIVKNYLSWLRAYNAGMISSVIARIIFVKTKKVFYKIFWVFLGGILSLKHSLKRLLPKRLDIDTSAVAIVDAGVLASNLKSDLSLKINLKKNPRISVLMPVFNCEKYIFIALDSILKQTYCDFELIVINDVSNDGSMEVVNSIVDSRIKIINLEINCGIVTALNKGLEVSRGEFIARMDADDISLPTRLATQVQYLDAHPQVGLIGSWIRGFGENIDPFIHRYPLLNDEIKCRLLFENSFAHSTILFRKSILDVNGLKYDTNFQYVEDWNLWSQLSRYTKFSNIPTPLVEYRVAEKGKKYREFQHSQKEKLISKNLFTANFPYREIDIDAPSVDRGSLQKLASYLCELRDANAESHAFKPHIFERQLSWIWVKSCLGLGKIGFFYSLYDNKKYHLNISNYDILNIILCMVRYRFSDFIFLKMNNWIRR